MTYLNRVHIGNALELAEALPSRSIHCIVTSPPYFGLRDYGLPPFDWPAVEYAPMAGLPPVRVEAWRGCLGLEPDPFMYVSHLVAIFRALRRVLRSDGTAWVNLGDKSQTKQLLGIPWHVAMALQADGWWLRSDVIWHKPNSMPSSVTDRPTKAHEYLFLFSKEPRYFYDQEAIREPAKQHRGSANTFARNGAVSKHILPGQTAAEHRPDRTDTIDAAAGRNRRDVWTIPSSPFPGAHFATYPPALIEPAILAGTSAKGVCPGCLNPWRRIVEPTPEYAKYLGKDWADYDKDQAEGRGHFEANGFKSSSAPTKRGPALTASYVTVGWEPTCDCPPADPVPAVVLDPFIGSGTTAQVAIEHRRNWIGFEANPDYAEELVSERLNGTQVRLI